MANGLLLVTALLETATAVALLASPSVVTSLLLGVSIDTAGGLVVARVAGAALLSLGLACWLIRQDGQSRAGRALIGAMLVYNIAVIAVLLHARLGLSLAGIGLWPGVGLHAVLAVWCIFSQPLCCTSSGRT